MSRRAVRVTLGIGVVAAVAVRLAHFAALAGSAYPEIPRYLWQTDLHAYLRWAETIVAGDVLGRETYHPHFDWMQAIGPPEAWHRWWGGRAIFQQAPLYAYWVAAGLWAFAGSLRALMLLQLLVGALQPLALYALARRVLDERAGLLAAALGALYGPLVFHQGVLLRDGLAPVLEPLALVLLLRAVERGRGRDWALAGACLGAALLLREAVLLFLPLALGWAAWTARPGARRALAAVGGLALGLALALAPLAARNALVGAPLLALSNRAAEGFIEGNARDADPVGLHHPASMRDILERSGGRLPAVIRETLATHRGEWSRLLALQWAKLRALVDPFEVPNNVAWAYGLELSPVLRATLGYGTVWPLAIAGVALAARATPAQGLLALHALAVVGGVMLSIVLARYRLALVPALLVYAAAGAVRARDALRARDLRRLGAGLGVLVAAALVQHVAAPGGPGTQRANLALHAPDYVGTAEAYARAGDFARALQEVSRLRARAQAQPERFVDPLAASYSAEAGIRILWATRLIEDGRADEARRQVEQAEAAYARGGPDPVAPYNVGLLALRLGDRAWAARAFERFLEDAPEGPEAERARRWLAARRGATR